MKHNTHQHSEVTVTFTGGLGAQIFSAAIYFFLKNKGHTVYADMEYFNRPGKMATIGNKGEVTHWSYELGEYGLPLESFPAKKFKKKLFFKHNLPHVIPDGPEKAALAVEALRRPEIKKLFPIKTTVAEKCREISGGNDYLCIHIRRGDYINVSSHIVDDVDFINMAKPYASFVPSVIVISDSEVSDLIKENVTNLFLQCSFVVGGDLHTAHALIRQAKYLICSNSQFSLSAAILNEVVQQIFVPTQWFSDINTIMQKPINSLCRFQVLSTI